jgi:hypothetical protein
MTTKHTPAPWKYRKARNVERPFIIIDCTKINPYFVAELNGGCDDTAKANAEHIVKCVNLHDELVAGLMDAHPHIADDKLRASIGNLITKARGEV